MMKKIRLFATLRDIAGAKELAVPLDGVGTVRDLIRAVSETCPELGRKILNDQGELSGLVHVFVQGRNVMWLEGLDTVIGETDEIILVPPVAGG